MFLLYLFALLTRFVTFPNFSAGPNFSCGLSWSGVLNYGCFGGSCGVGNGAKLKANVNTCLTDKDYSVKLELSVCVDVISDFLYKVGRWISSVENFLRKNFNIYSGCLRLAKGEYDITNNRLEVAVGPLHKDFTTLPFFKFTVGGNGKLIMFPSL